MWFAGCGQPTNTPTETPDATQTEQPSTPEETPAPTEAPATTGPDGREFADEQVYRTLYSSEVTTMNYLKSGTTYELVVGANTIDSLVENDPYGNIVPAPLRAGKSAKTASLGRSTSARASIGTMRTATRRTPSPRMTMSPLPAMSAMRTTPATTPTSWKAGS